jgi:signal transduction histidine kinase
MGGPRARFRGERSPEQHALGSGLRGAVDTSLSQASILIVDDDSRTLQALQELLQSATQKVVLANSGEEALRCVLKQDFAVILLDARLPGVDGFETARLIRERERSRHTPIIFLTGAYEDVHSVFRGYEAGAVDYIVKPLVPEILKSKISVFVELYNKNAVLVGEIAERRRVEEHLRKSEENLRALAAHLQSVREEEWTRIAREIHDELGQSLTGLKMDLIWVANRLPGDQRVLSEKAKSMSGLIDDTIQSVRKIASRLRPEVLDQLGLTAAIGWHAADFRKRTGIRCKLVLPSDTLMLDRERSTAAFRIFQELLTNVARHADATRIDVALRVDSGALVLTVEDNGKGIAESAIHDPKSLGLLGMRERVLPFGGAIEVAGVQGKGTKVRVSISLGLK